MVFALRGSLCVTDVLLYSGICTSCEICTWTVRTTRRRPTLCCCTLSCWRSPTLQSRFKKNIWALRIFAKNHRDSQCLPACWFFFLSGRTNPARLIWSPETGITCGPSRSWRRGSSRRSSAIWTKERWALAAGQHDNISEKIISS